MPVWDKSDRTDGTFKRSDFSFDASTDSYTCPGGKTLKHSRRRYKTPRTAINQDNTIRYRALVSDCRGCSLKSKCCPNVEARKVTRSVHEAARDVARAVAKTPLYQQSCKDRKQVEMLFAHLKRILKLDRLRLRGLSGASDEFLLAATVQNLKRMARRLCTGPPLRELATPA